MNWKKVVKHSVSFLIPWESCLIEKERETFKKLNTLSPLKNYIASGVFLGLAVLTKGPAAILIAGGVVGVYMIYKRFKNFVSIQIFIIFK